MAAVDRPMLRRRRNLIFDDDHAVGKGEMVQRYVSGRRKILARGTYRAVGLMKEIIDYENAAIDNPREQSVEHLVAGVMKINVDMHDSEGLLRRKLVQG
jgi:hypothetical protein